MGNLKTLTGQAGALLGVKAVESLALVTATQSMTADYRPTSGAPPIPWSAHDHSTPPGVSSNWGWSAMDGWAATE